ncbi:response regulator transcription factor [Aequorivita viscosa]|uniref:response regulator transcription factor n=1 Tax=Aequorivita viscosa TaxID=797419 RepID=UPI0009F89174|nr:LuxR C-terminal-related transcriptional regulator [Aequorivita viscosa]
MNSLYKGGTYIGENLKNKLQYEASPNSNIEKLSATELKILKNISNNLNSSQIAETLFISKRTVEKHRSNIIKKLEIDATQQNALFVWLQQHPNIFNT